MEELKSQEESATTEEIKTNQESSEEIISIAEPSLTDKSSTDTISSGADVVATKKKVSKKKLGIIIGIVGVVAVIAIVLVIALIPSEFNKVKKACIEIGGSTVTSGNGYFTIETIPDSMSVFGEMDPAQRELMLYMYQKDALEAIEYANKELGFPDDVYSQMMHTNALMGRQSEETDKYTVSWTFHPDDGLTVTYRKK